jgi:hypothetical protein
MAEVPDKPESFPFDAKDLNRINTNLIIGILAQQQVLFDVLFQHFGISRDQMLLEIQEKEKSIVSHLYTLYGMTPDVLLPDKDQPTS